MSRLMIEVSETTATRLLNRSMDLQISVATLLEQISLEFSSKGEGLGGKKQEQLVDVEPEESKRATPGVVKDSEWLQVAVNRAKAVNPAGTKFSLRTLFTEEEWGLLPSPRVFGRMFREAIEPKYAERRGDDEDWGVAQYVRNATQG